MKNKLHIISVGGSIIVPKTGIDIGYLKKLKQTLSKFTRQGHRFVIVTGGGATARQYIEASKKAGASSRDDLDWVGIAATRVNAELVRAVLGDRAHPTVITDPSKPLRGWTKPILVAAGWKPGWSTDYIATRLGQKLGAKQVINLSNIKYLYDKDPNKYKSAKVIKEIDWPAFRKIVGNKWNPGANLPFDPIAARLAQKAKMSVVLANGKNIKNLEKILRGEKFQGTLIG